MRLAVEMSKKLKLTIGILLPVCVIGFGAILWLWNPAEKSLFPPCPFYKLTGLYCPGCGSIRGLHQILHLNFYRAIEYNVLMVAALPFVLYGLICQYLRYFFDLKIPVLFVRAGYIWTLLGVVIIYAILRNIPIFPFSWLAPV